MEQIRVAEIDPVVIERGRRGDPQAFASIVERYQSPVYNLAYRMLGNAPDAEDAAQETFLRAYSRLKTFRPGQKFATWLLSIAAHYCIDRLRRSRFNAVSLDDERAVLAAVEGGPEETAFAHEREAQVSRLLDQLPPTSRAIVVLKYWHDLGVEEIAAATGESVSAVKVRLFRARQSMARAMASGEKVAAPAGQRLKSVATDV